MAVSSILLYSQLDEMAFSQPLAYHGRWPSGARSSRRRTDFYSLNLDLLVLLLSWLMAPSDGDSSSIIDIGLGGDARR
jgi:hypothetical protein